MIQRQCDDFCILERQFLVVKHSVDRVRDLRR
jgi:hypothetical protein